MAANDILEIVTPVLNRICDYYISEQNGYELRYEEFSAEISRLLNEARRLAEKNEALKADFRKIEFPLIFFIDYTVKESGFSFSRDYVPMAHSYNELSGDDKFFDLFDEAIRVEKNPDILTLYYIMLGLGFDGAYRREPVEVIRRMQTCAEMLEDRLKTGYDEICLVHKNQTAFGDNSWNTFRSVKILSVMSLVTLLCFALNWLSVQASTAPFRNSIKQALKMAAPSKDYLVDTTNTMFQAGAAPETPADNVTVPDDSPAVIEDLEERDIPQDNLAPLAVNPKPAAVPPDAKPAAEPDDALTAANPDDAKTAVMPDDELPAAAPLDAKSAEANSAAEPDDAGPAAKPDNPRPRARSGKPRPAARSANPGPAPRSDAPKPAAVPDDANTAGPRVLNKSGKAQHPDTAAAMKEKK
ncbi:DotU family type IV/VI secretion system protein [Succinimonas sp.]|uniref:DotU family type IV/VI secretion system protein n=1 Tax=Succinimonas sp. TaxID=1936151 RepID=UPI0038693C8D